MVTVAAKTGLVMMLVQVIAYQVEVKAQSR